MSSPSLPDRRKRTTETLGAHLWDLRSQAEAKLRCLTRLQQHLTQYDSVVDETDRADKRQHILTDLNDIVTISKALHDVANLALEEANGLS